MWIISALSASLFWGLTYAIDEQIFKGISVSTSLAITCFFTSLFLTFISFINGSLKNDLISISISRRLFLLVIVGTITFIIAELLIGLSIQAKNATLAGIIEISYPVFVALFTYLIFKESQINMKVLIGGLLIFAGVFIIYFFEK